MRQDSESSTNPPNAGKRMSAAARICMRETERAMLKYYNDLGRDRGNCTWGIGFFEHAGPCTREELARQVSAAAVDLEYDRRVAEAERRVKQKVKVPLDQAHFDAVVSFTFNTRSATNQRLYDALNGGNMRAAAAVISAATHVKIGAKTKLAPGLIRRRAEEAAPFRNVSATK